MSLYDDLDIKEESGNEKIKQSVVPGWSPGYKLLASTLQAKKASILQPKKQRTSHLAPVVDLKRHVNDNAPMQFNMQTGKLERISIAIQPQATIAVAPITPQPLSLSPFHGGDSSPLVSGVADEYNPLCPNEYDEVMKRKKEEKQKERENDRRNRDDRGDERRDDRDRDRDRHRDRDRDRDRRRQDRRNNDDGESEMERMRKRRAEDDEEEEIDRSKRGGAAIAPPSILLEEPPVNADDNRPKSPQNMGMAMMGSVASKIMAKYGYKEGQGLGKSEQGMSTALYVEKTSKRGGKIIHEKDIPKELPPASNTNLMKNPSKVILLQNMVGPGEVDEELEPETAEECSKYGKVNKCVIFEMPELPEDETVRIFIEFERMESAIKAVVDLNGRFFGGRVVKANFYNLDKFRRMDYSSPVD